MKNSTKSRIFLLFTIAFFTSAMAFSQSIMQGNPEREIREAAEQKAAMWQDELALTSKQTDLMERKFIEFGMKKQRLLQSKMREDEKTRRLKRLQVLENKDMRDILTQPQYDRYLVTLQKKTKKKMKKMKKMEKMKKQKHKD
ncbi:MAG: hypothetical protein WBL27_10510 [Salinimicrobium sp.]